MSTTVLQLLTRSLRLVRAIAAGDTPTALEAQDALTALNGMLSTWALERLMVYSLDRSTFATVANQGTYTIGVGGNWNTTRPVKIDAAGWVDTSTTPNPEYPLRVLTDEEYQWLYLKGMGGVWAEWLYYDRASPLGHVILYPVPSMVRSVALYLWHPLGQMASVNDVLSFPPGYENALAFNLALYVAPEYGLPVSADVRDRASETKRLIESVNMESPVAQFDQGLGRTRGGGWLAGTLGS